MLALAGRIVKQKTVADALLCMGRRAEAAKWLDKALKRDPKNKEALANKATCSVSIIASRMRSQSIES
jgi:hypothetical protein